MIDDNFSKIEAVVETHIKACKINWETPDFVQFNCLGNLSYNSNYNFFIEHSDNRRGRIYF